MDAFRDHPANAAVIRSLCKPTGKKGGVYSNVGVEAYPRLSDCYYGCGSHPEIVERVWDDLGRDLPEGRRVLCGTPALVHPGSGVILAVCYGTQYGLRVPEDAFAAALQVGCTTVQRWTGGGETDLAREFGPGWVFGRWAKEEAGWCRAVIAAFSPPP